MKNFIKVMFIVATAILAACTTDPDPAEFTSTELRDLTPIMQFKGNPIPEECFSKEHLTVRDGCNENSCGDPYYKIYCHFFFDPLSTLDSAMRATGWALDVDEGLDGDCGDKRVYKQTVDHRKLRVYIKTCDGDGLFVSNDRFYFNVEYQDQ